MFVKFLHKYDHDSFFPYWAALFRVGSLCRMKWGRTCRPFNRTFSYSSLFLPQYCFVPPASVYPAVSTPDHLCSQCNVLWREHQINVLPCHLRAQGLVSIPNSKGAGVRTARYMCNGKTIKLKGQWLCIVVFEKIKACCNDNKNRETVYFLGSKQQ